MGKASRWLRNLFLPGWKGRKAKDRGAADADCQSVLSAPLPSHSQAATAAPSGREKRRWSFRRPGAGASGGAQGQGPLASSSSHCFSEAEVHVVVVAQEQDQQQQVAAVVPEAASSTAGAVVPLPASVRTSGAGGGRGVEAAAAVKIQAAFRSYLVRAFVLARFSAPAILHAPEWNVKCETVCDGGIIVPRRRGRRCARCEGW
jgi:hypothetical protein